MLEIEGTLWDHPDILARSTGLAWGLATLRLVASPGFLNFAEYQFPHLWNGADCCCCAPSGGALEIKAVLVKSPFLKDPLSAPYFRPGITTGRNAQGNKRVLTEGLGREAQPGSAQKQLFVVSPS